MKLIFAFTILALCGLTAIKAQVVNVQCTFLTVDSTYTCQIFGISVADNENANFVIGGVHQPGNTNAHVNRVSILFSGVPFIITQLFTTFPFLRNLQIMSGLTRIQSNAFANAPNLWNVEIMENPSLQTIHANAFSGAPNIRILDMHRNGIETIHATAFAGLNSLQSLFIEGNQIRQLPWNLFLSTFSLQRIVLDDNQLGSIDGRLFSNNTRMVRIDMARNQINAIQRTFLDRMPALSSLNMQGNICANSFWTIGGGTTIETIRQGLQTCFNNFVDAPVGDERHFVMKLRGSMTIRHENGTEIITI